MESQTEYVCLASQSKHTYTLSISHKCAISQRHDGKYIYSHTCALRSCTMITTATFTYMLPSSSSHHWSPIKYMEPK